MSSEKKEYKRLWYQKNKSSEKSKAKEWRDNHPQYLIDWRGDHNSDPQTRFAKAKSNVKKRKRTWSITREQYYELVSKPCHYCSTSIANETGCGLDRLDNNGNYDVKNVVTCCGVCNSSRNENFTSEEWMIGIQAILEFRKRARSDNGSTSALHAESQGSTPCGSTNLEEFNL